VQVGLAGVEGEEPAADAERDERPEVGDRRCPKQLFVEGLRAGDIIHDDVETEVHDTPFAARNRRGTVPRWSGQAS